MSVKINFQGRHPHDDYHTACSTPNPPWWCDDAPHTNIDMGIGFLIGMGLIIGMVTIYIKRSAGMVSAIINN